MPTASATGAICALLVSAFLSSAAAQTARVDNRTPAGDAVTILDPGGGRVVKWAAPPRVLAFVSTDAERAVIADKLAELERLTGFAFPDAISFGAGATETETEIRFADAALLADPDRSLALQISRLRSGERMIQLTLGEAGANRIYGADIILAILDTPAQARFGAARNADGRPLWTEIARGEIPCFVEVARPRGVPILDYAFVLLNPDHPAYDLAGCVHEELFQAMGLPNDAVGSPFFSFDNRTIAQDQRLDRLLIQALYDPDTPPGASVFDVVARFDALRRATPR